MERLLIIFIYMVGIDTWFSVCFLIEKFITLLIMVSHKPQTESLFTEQTQGARFLWTTFPLLNRQKTATKNSLAESVHELMKLKS